MSETSATGADAPGISEDGGSKSGEAPAGFDELSTTGPVIEPASGGSTGEPDHVASSSSSVPREQSSKRLIDAPDRASSPHKSPTYCRASENLAGECDHNAAPRTGLTTASDVAGDAAPVPKDKAAIEAEKCTASVALHAAGEPAVAAGGCSALTDNRQGAASDQPRSATEAPEHGISGEGGAEPRSSCEGTSSGKPSKVAFVAANTAAVDAVTGLGNVGDIDGLLEQKASKARLSATNVKTIIQEVLTDPGVLTMLRNSLEQDTDKLVPATYEPKMTRAKVKQVLAREGNAPVPWPLSPAKNRDLSYLLSDVTFADDEEEEDDEYSPDPESLDESDDEESTLDGSQLEEPMDDESMASPAISEPRSAMASTPIASAVPPSPVLIMPPLDLSDPQPARHSLPPVVSATVPAPSSSALSSQQPTVEMSKDSERHFLNALAELEFEPPIAGRTRSKAPLTEQKLECLEAQLVAPDVLPDMYGLLDPLNLSGATDDDDIYREELEWKTFLGSLFASGDGRQTCEQRSIIEEEENDPEYNVLAAIEADEEEEEDYRSDGKVKIPKAEIHNLMDELVEAYEAEDDMPEPLSEHSAHASQSLTTPQPSASAVEHKIRPHAPVVRDLIRNNERTQAPNDPAVSSGSDAVDAQLIPVVTAAESLQIQEHMRKHVQLLLQVFVLTLGRADLEDHNAMSKKLLVELAVFRDNSLLKSLSHFNAFNLDEAIRVVQDSSSVLQLVTRDDSCNTDIVHKALEGVALVLPEESAEVGACKDHEEVAEGSTEVAGSGGGQQACRLHPGKSPVAEASLSSGEMEFFANCMACIYPRLMPRQRLTAAKPVRRFFTASEDNLIILGLEQFGGLSGKFKWMHLLLLPVHDPAVIKSRVSRVRHGTKKCPLSAYLKHRVLPSPVRIIEVFDQSRACRPIDWDESLSDVPSWLKVFRCQQHTAQQSASSSVHTEHVLQVSPALAGDAPKSKEPQLLLQTAATDASVPTAEAPQVLPLSGAPLIDCTVVPAAALPPREASSSAALTDQPSLRSRLESWTRDAAPEKELPAGIGSSLLTAGDAAQVSNTAFCPPPIVAATAADESCFTSNHDGMTIAEDAPVTGSDGRPISSAATACRTAIIGSVLAHQSDARATAENSALRTSASAAGYDSTDIIPVDPIASDSGAAAAVTIATGTSSTARIACDDATVSVDAHAGDHSTSNRTCDVARLAGFAAGTDSGHATADAANVKLQSSSGTLQEKATTLHDVMPGCEPAYEAPMTSTVVASARAARKLSSCLEVDVAAQPVSSSLSAVLLPTACRSPLLEPNTCFIPGTAAASEGPSPAGATIPPGVHVECTPGVQGADGCTLVTERAIAVQGFEDVGSSSVAFQRAPQCPDSSQLSPPAPSGTPGIVVVLTPPSQPVLRPLFRTPSPRRRAPRPLVAAATPPSATSTVSARFSPLSVKKTLRSPRRRLLRSHVRQLVPKGFVLGASAGASAFSSACSPSKLVARSLTQRAVKTSVSCSGGGSAGSSCSGRAKLIPVNPGRDETLVEAATLSKTAPQAHQKGRGRGRVINATVSGAACGSRAADTPVAATATSSIVPAAVDDEDDDLIALMEASTTIRQAINTGSAPCRLKKRKLDRNLACLAADIMVTDPLKEEKDAAVAKAFLLRCRAVLGRGSAAYSAFLSALADFDGGSMTQLQLFHAVREVLLAPTGGCSSTTATAAGDAAATAGDGALGTSESREAGADDVKSREQLLSDFAAFLSPEQAFECGTQVYAASIEYDRARMFLRKLEVYFGRHAAAYQRIVRLLTSWDESRQPLAELKDAVVPLLKGHPYLLDDFRAFFPDEPVPKRFLADYEHIDLSSYEDDKVLSVPSLNGGYEEIEIPDVEDTQATEKCRCGCHSEVADRSQSLLYKQRLVHCRLCCVRVIGGRLYIHTPRGFKPACVSFADQEATVQAGDEKVIDEGSSPQREFVELVPPAGESEEELEDGGPAEDAEDDEEADFEAEQDDEDEVEDYAVDYYDDDASDDDARSAVACSPVLCSPLTPGSVASPMMVADEQPAVVATEPTTSDASSSRASLTASSTVSWQATELRPWCRDEDKLILETLQDEDVSSDASDAIFQRIAGQMQNRTLEQVRARFHHLLDLFANEYGGTLDT